MNAIKRIIPSKQIKGINIRYFNTSHIQSIQLTSTCSQKQLKNRRKLPTLGLQHFLLFSQSRKLWRDIVRTSYQIKDPITRNDLIDFAKQEFKHNKNVKDAEQLRYLISIGSKQFRDMSKTLGLSMPDVSIDLHANGNNLVRSQEKSNKK